MKAYVHMKEALEKKDPQKRSFVLLDDANGCMSGCRMGITINSNEEYLNFGAHEDQEGFFVLEGEGYATVGDEEFEISEGTSFIALPGVSHAVRTRCKDKPVKVLWFHSAV